MQARLLPVRREGDTEEDDVPPELLPAALSENDGPIVVYVDELQLAMGEPGPGDHEIFLRDMPLEDYTETQLREWLEGCHDQPEIILHWTVSNNSMLVRLTFFITCPRNCILLELLLFGLF